MPKYFLDLDTKDFLDYMDAPPGFIKHMVFLMEVVGSKEYHDLPVLGEATAALAWCEVSRKEPRHLQVLQHGGWIPNSIR